MQNKFITEMFGIKERCIEVDHIEMVDNAFHVHLSTKQRRLSCPRCKQKTDYNHNYRTQPVQGRLIEEKPVTLYLQKRRYACKACGKTFYEPLKLVKRYQRRTTSLNEQLLVYASENSFTMAGKMGGVTTSSVLRSFDHRSIPEKRILPQVIAIDEFKGDADNEKFQTIIVDVEKKLLKSCRTVALKLWRSFFKAVTPGMFKWSLWICLVRLNIPSSVLLVTL